jgi:coenzyme A diphosphatase NUDT7
MVGYDQQPEFPITAPTQRTMIQRIEYEIRYGSSALRRGVEAEGMAGDWAEGGKAKL